MRKKVIIILIIILCGGYIWGMSQMSGFNSNQEKIFIIEKGQGVNEISKNLHSQGFIKNSFIFETYVWLKKVEGKFQSGQYSLNTNSGTLAIIEKLTSGNVLSQEREIKIIEGWNIKDIGTYLEEENIISEDAFSTAAKGDDLRDSLNYDFLKSIPKENDIEGFLFPDTYRIYNNANAIEIRNKMLENFEEKLTDQMKQDIAIQGKNIYEIVTMASIIEKEVTDIKDMKKISDIFWRRIAQEIPLQSCATIAYVLGINKKQYTYEDTRIESPYNTYLNQNLPPGPICNPGFNAINAAIYPEDNSYWYFLSDEEGNTIFSKTLEEHNRNKAKYLK